MSTGWRPPTLETARLLLRPLTPADAEAMFEACSNPRVTDHTCFDTHRTLDTSRGFIAGYAATSYAAGVPDPLTITLKETPDRLIGCIGARWEDKGDGRMDLGYWLAEPFWGRGIVTEAARVFVPFLFATYPVERLQSRVFEGNPASGRVLEKAGLTYEGTLRKGLKVKGRFRDVRMYSRLREENERG
ncbi:MAG: GNAT family protein [Gemmataceae bacterium]